MPSSPQLPQQSRQIDIGKGGQSLARGAFAFSHKEENREENKDGGWLRQEFKKRSFSRSFAIDDTVIIRLSPANGFLSIKAGYYPAFIINIIKFPGAAGGMDEYTAPDYTYTQI